MTPLSLPSQAEILLLCDSAKLARAIELTLHTDGHFRTRLIDQPVVSPLVGADPWDLMVIAYSKPSYAPLDVLRQAGLTQWVGRRPMLVIAPYPFACQPDQWVWCLEFPFEAQALSTRVAEILSASPGGAARNENRQWP
jgi:hypothetical protein